MKSNEVECQKITFMDEWHIFSVYKSISLHTYIYMKVLVYIHIYLEQLNVSSISVYFIPN